MLVLMQHAINEALDEFSFDAVTKTEDPAVAWRDGGWHVMTDEEKAERAFLDAESEAQSRADENAYQSFRDNGR
jgi:hypothetical protein